ncbi:hypothetical protein AYO40_01780 [Planctomycetaceae bacterium SCGC AG-212-D15]|nr:hypothetical protein AYO40_01780 [Planctomycetaceae bacterium SCGC AG-212-D15]
MPVVHEVYFAGAEKSVELELETDDLFRQFKRWLESDGIPRGMVVATEDRSHAINFSQVASISVGEKPTKRMGF